MSLSPIDALERPEGGFAMLALDQRESMRDILGTGTTEDDLRRFKSEAAAALAPAASAILLDRLYGIADQPPSWTSSTPVILAADHFDQPPGEAVKSSVLDDGVTVELIERVGASALKFLALWRRSESASDRADLVHRFIDLAHAAGVPAIVEGIVRPDNGSWGSVGERDDAIVDGAAELAGYGADLYKAEVPGSAEDLESVERGALRISEALNCRWVVLSNGVAPDAFPDAVSAACRGGASGFLAGRAIWTAAAHAVDSSAALRTDALQRLQQVSSRVPDRNGGLAAAREGVGSR